MTAQFEDMPDGAGKRATEDDYKRIWLYMQSRNRHPSVRSVITEIAAQNYVPPSVATSQRWAKKLSLSHVQTESVTKDADTRLCEERKKLRVNTPTTEHVAAATGQTIEKVERNLRARMEALLKDDNSSTQLAIDENRTRMAFNIALMEFYAAEPGLLANLRDTAALIDAITVASKLSGGASIDITLPTNGDQTADGFSPAGHPMKTIGDPLKNVDQTLVSKFRDFQLAARNGQGA